MTERKKEDFYSEDGKTEYCFDKYGNRHEVGPSFKDIPMGVEVTFCPICRACKNEVFNEQKFVLECRVKGEQPKDIIFNKVCYCDSFDGNENSYDYDIVMKQIEEYNNKKQEG